ncbi:MAG TPA: DNA gyrase subunit A, partial [Candidatus Ventrousia excrementavium]|nr:DNA gyrase subunit A [Candidatus Ventrousia excrementavium]
DEAPERLMERFSITEVQAQAILDMQLRRLQGLEREKIEAELNSLHAKIAEYKEILASSERIYSIVKTEMQDIARRFGDERRTEISHVENEIDIEDLIPEETCVYTLTDLGYIKRMPTAAYRAQKRGGRGVTGVTTRDEDFVETIFTASTHDNILFFTNSGKVQRLRGYQVPESSRTAKGMNIVNLLQLEGGEKITAMIPVHGQSEGSYIFFVTKKGTVKRIALSLLKTARKAGVRAISLDEDDEVVSVRLTGGDDRIILATRDGQAIRFHESEVRPMGRDAAGVRGIRLHDGDEVVGAARERKGAYVLTVTENGYGKLTLPDEFTEHHRGGSGITAHNLTEKTGALMGIKCVDLTDDLMLITSEGVIIRTGCDSIRICGRSSQGVILMRLAEGVKVISLARTAREEDEADEASEQNTAGADPVNEDEESQG